MFPDSARGDRPQGMPYTMGAPANTAPSGPLFNRGLPVSAPMPVQQQVRSGGHWEWSQDSSMPASAQMTVAPMTQFSQAGMTMQGASVPMTVQSGMVPMTMQSASAMTVQGAPAMSMQGARGGRWEWESMGAQQRSPTPPRMPQTGTLPMQSQSALGGASGHWEWQAERSAAAPIQSVVVQGQSQVVEKIVYVDRPVEVIVEKIVERPIYVDRPVPMAGMQFGMQSQQQFQTGYQQQMGMEVVNPMQMGSVQNTAREAEAFLQAEDHHHVIERPVYIHAERPQDGGSAAVIREVQVVERPVYIQTPIPIPFERPVPVPVPQSELEREKKVIFERQYGRGNDAFPYHCPYNGCDFVDGRMEASSDQDPVKSFLENFRPY